MMLKSMLHHTISARWLRLSRHKLAVTALTLGTISLGIMAPGHSAQAQDLLIQNAQVHTATSAGTLEQADVLIRDGRIAAIGFSLKAAAEIARVDARGRHLTPGLFGGFTGLGLVDVEAEESSVSHSLNLSEQPALFPTMRPEFNPLRAYNPHTSAVAVNRTGGISFAFLAPLSGGSLIHGQGQLARLDGSYQPALQGSDTLVIQLGAGAQGLAGESRAGEYLILEQAFAEAQARAKDLDGESRLLTLRGRQVLARYLKGGRVLLAVNRAADILQALALAREQGFKPLILGGAEAWKVADALATAQVPVLLNPLEDLPGNFDKLGARMDNAARLEAAGVPVVFSFQNDSHNIRKLRQAAGNAVAHGMSWEGALKAITSNAASAFGQGDNLGSISPGQRADLVLWSGDPLEVTSVVHAMWFDGKAQSLGNRQQQLRDRYLPQGGNLPRQYLKPVSSEASER